MIDSRRWMAAFVLSCVGLPSAGCDDGRALREPTPAALAEAAPDSFSVRFETSAGEFVVRFRREWSPRGVDRVHYLARHGFFEGARFFRVNPRVVQFGYSGRPALDSVWRALPLADEPVRASNVRGAVAFARAGPDTRDFQLFVNRVDNPQYDTCCGGGFPPLGEVVEGMAAVDRIMDAYGELEPGAQDRIFRDGNAYLRERYPALDSITTVEVVR